MRSVKFVRHLAFLAAVLALLGLSAPAAASQYGNFVPLTSSGLPAAGDVSQVAVNAAGELFATVYGDGVYRSTDGGETFVKLAAPNFGMTNDIPNLEMMTMIVNALGEPIIGCREVGASPGQYLFRLDWANRTWVAASIPSGKDISTDGYDATGAATIQLGGVSIPKQRRFPRHFTLDTNGAIWLGWSYIAGFLRSTDNGSTYQYIAAPIATTGANAGIGPGNVYSFNQNKQTGEFFYGTEQNGFWHSTDGGNTWLPLDPTGTTTLGTHQNDYSIGFNKDQEPIFSSWGRSNALPSGGPVFTILNRSGVEVNASSGLTNFQFNKQNTFYQYNGGDAIMRNIRVDSVGYNFISAYSSSYYNNQVPNGGKQTVYLSLNGYTWVEADVNQPFVSPYANSIATDGTAVFVGGKGQVWKFVINVLNNLPVVTMTPPPSTITYRTPVALQGSASDADAEPLTYTWKARGPGNATFQTGTAASTIASFDKPGDYVVTFSAADSFRSASAASIIHVIDAAPVVVTPAAATVVPPSFIELSVLGDDLAVEGGEAGLTYTWIPEVVPSGASVIFSVNGTNAAKSTRATVNMPGTYTFAVMIQDDGGQMVGSAVSALVTQVIGSLNVSPSSQFVPNSGTQQFTAVAKDTNGVLMNPQPTVTWSVDGGGAISPTGVFTADGVSTGVYTVTATSGALSQTATVMTVINDAPVFASPPSCTPGTVTLPGTGSLFVDVSDPDNVPGLGVTYAWSKVSGPGNVTFTSGTSSKLTSAAFSAAGVYQLRVDATDTLSVISSTITVVVNPDPTIPVAISLQNGVNGYTSEVDLGISTQSAAAYNGMNGNTFRISSLPVQDTAATGGFAGEALIRFDNLNLPPGAKVLSATLTLYFSTYVAGYSVTGRYLNAFWNQAAPQYKIGWINRDTNLLWSTPGALGEGTDLVAGKSFTIGGFALAGNQVKTVVLDPAVVRNWVDAPSTNNGILLTSNVAHTGTVSSSFDTTIARRPKLSLVYETAIAESATATPAIVSGSSTALHVAGTSFPTEGGEPSLTYTWSVAPGSPNAPVIFSQNGTNAAKDTVATFSKAGTYGMRVAITDASGVSVTSAVDVFVSATPSLITVSPANAITSTVQPIGFSASVTDQFGAAIMPPPVVTWSASGGGAVDGGGLFTPDGSGGLFQIGATLNGLSGWTYVTVVQNAAPAISAAVATPSSFALPNGTTLSVTASDPDSYPGNGLTYTWSLGGGPAAVIFGTSNGTAAAANITAAFTVPGSYTLRLTVSDGISTSGTNVPVTVAQDPLTPVIASFQQGVNGYAGGVDATITTQSQAAYNNMNGNVFKTAVLYVQDTSATGGFKGKALIRFNNLGLPTGAIVTNATLQLTFATYVANFSATGRYLNTSWDSSAPTYKFGWMNRDATHLWAVAGASGDGTDLVSNSSFTMATVTTGANQVRTVNLDTAVIQSWVTNPAVNQGVEIFTAAGLTSQFSGATDTTVAKRPKLVITYHL